MTFSTQKLSAFGPYVSDDIGSRPAWNERIVMGIAVSLGVLIVVIVAVLLGMT